MNGPENATMVVTARLPSGAPVRVEVAGAESSDGMTSVGLRDLDLGNALDTVAEIGSVVVDKLKAAKPARATVELKLGFAVEAGKLTALWVNGKSEASLTVTLEWSERPAGPGGGDG
jgi:Trypsin-co-occurring domain 1